jgi:hypothetical protein
LSNKLTKQQRELLRSLISKTIILRYTTAESLSYIKQELGVSISESYFFEVKANIVEENEYVMEHYGEKMHASLLSEFMKRIREMELCQSEQWAIYHKTDDLKFKADLIMKLAELTIRLEELYNLLPDWINLSKGESPKIRTNVDPLTGLELNNADFSREAKF